MTRSSFADERRMDRLRRRLAFGQVNDDGNFDFARRDHVNVHAGLRDVITAEKIGKLSIVGVGMKSHTGVAGKLFETLAEAGVNIDMISTSEIKISVVIDLAKGEAATKAVHAAFIG